MRVLRIPLLIAALLGVSACKTESSNPLAPADHARLDLGGWNGLENRPPIPHGIPGSFDNHITSDSVGIGWGIGQFGSGN